MTVGEMTRRMSAREEMTWMAKCRDKPLPTQQIVHHLAQIAQFIHMVNVDKKDRKPMSDFLLYFREKIKPQNDVDTSIRSFFGLTKDK